MLNEGLEKLVAGGDYDDENGVRRQYRGMFRGSGLAEVMLPGTLQKISGPVFDGCGGLKTVWVGDGCAVNVRRSVGRSAQILQSK